MITKIKLDLNSWHACIKIDPIIHTVTDPRAANNSGARSNFFFPTHSARATPPFSSTTWWQRAPTCGSGTTSTTHRWTSWLSLSPCCAPSSQVRTNWGCEKRCWCSTSTGQSPTHYWHCTLKSLVCKCGTRVRPARQQLKRS
jgi:hypothetical protein